MKKHLSRMGTGAWRLALGAALIASVGCATSSPQPIPRAPERRALTITAQRRQSQAQQDRDKADCQSVATAEATSSAGWAQLFIGCMSGRGYAVE